jgi:hypothetical protein
MRIHATFVARVLRDAIHVRRSRADESVPVSMQFTCAGHVLTRVYRYRCRSRADESVPVSMQVTCGSGVTACVIAAALHMVGVTDIPLYDGAYTEWKSKGGESFKGSDKCVY